MVNRIKSYFNEHLIVIAYFAFFLLALLPTIFSFFNRLGVFYKVGVLLLFTAFIVIYICKKRVQINYRYLSIPLTIFIVYGLYFLAVLPTYFTFVTPEYSYISGTSITVATSFKIRLNSIINVFNICYFAALFLVVAPSLNLKTSDILLFAVLTSIITLAACVYSIKGLKATNYEIEGLTSFLNNKNTFGQFLMVCIFECLLAFTICKKIYIKIAFSLLALIFLLFVILSKSSTAIVLSLLIVGLSIIFLILDNKKLKIFYKILILTAIGIIFAVVLVSPFIPFLAETKVGEIVKTLYDKATSFTQKGFLEAFSGRGKSWAFGGYIIRPEYLMLGYGNATLEEILYRSTISYFTTRELTNQYLTIINAYGVIGSILYLLVFAYLFYKYFKSDHSISEWLLILFLVFLIYGIFESLLLFESFSGSLLLTPLLVVPATYLKVEKKVRTSEETKK